jgi:hypothetical protein
MLVTARADAETDPLPSWSDTAPKAAILEFVRRVSTEGSSSYVPEERRVAVFDNDGTLWVEQPMYTQLAFAIDRVKQEADKHPEWTTTQPFQAVLENDVKALKEVGEKGLLELVMATHAGMDVSDFEDTVRSWIGQATDPRFHRKYTDLVYKPMLEVLDFLRANGFRIYIVSGGGIEFMRPWTLDVYGVAPDQVIGSSIKTIYEVQDGVPRLLRSRSVNFVNDGPGKPVGINDHIGIRPIAAFGNSDGDFEMLQWTTSGAGLTLGVVIHHTDAEREYAYDRKSDFGHLDKVLEAAGANKWVVVSMKDDWRTVFSFESN